jgi:hypothetical protein
MIATFAFKSRTNFSVQFIRDSSRTFRDLRAMTMQLKAGNLLKANGPNSGF